MNPPGTCLFPLSLYGSLGPTPRPPPHVSSPYLLHLLLAHAKLVVAKQKGPDVLADLVLHASVVNLPQQLQFLVVLRDPGSRDCAVPAVTPWATRPRES